MGARRKGENLLELMIAAPWWISALLATVSYVVLRWIAPAMLGRDTIGKILIPLFIQFSAWIALFFVVTSVFAGLRELLAHRKAVAHQGRYKIEPVVGLRGDVSSPSSRSAIPFARHSSLGTKPLTWSLDLLRELEWKRFEEVGAELFRELGFRAEMLARGPDGGVDVRLYADGGDVPVAIVQCKSWKARQVGIKALREFLGVMTHERIKEGIFLAAFDFTQEATQFGNANGIDVVDGKRFMGMVESLTGEAQQKLLRIATEGDYKTPSCPSCAVKLVRRSSSRGNFWGCANFPRCTFKLNIAVDS